MVYLQCCSIHENRIRLHEPEDDHSILYKELCKRIEEQMTAASFQITASIGYKIFRQTPELGSGVLLEADKIMCEAKTNGKSRVHCC